MSTPPFWASSQHSEGRGPSQHRPKFSIDFFRIDFRNTLYINSTLHYAHTTGKRAALATLLAGILLSLGSGSIAFAQDYQDWKFTHPKPQPNPLRKIQMIDANTWVAVGANGTFMRTTDAGANWYFHHQAGLPTNNALSIGGNYRCLVFQRDERNRCRRYGICWKNHGWRSDV